MLDEEIITEPDLPIEETPDFPTISEAIENEDEPSSELSSLFSDEDEPEEEIDFDQLEVPDRMIQKVII